MRALALLLSAAVSCIAVDSDDGSGGFPDAGPPPPDAAPPRCQLAATTPVVCDGAGPCPVIEAFSAECQDSLRAMDVALGDGAVFALVRVGGDRLLAPQLFSIAGTEIAELDARHQSFADRVVVAGDAPVYITQPEAQTPILDGDGAVVADRAGQLKDVAAGADGRVHVLYSTTEGALALATRDLSGTWSSAPVATSAAEAVLAIAGDQPYAIYTRDAEDAIRYQLPGAESVAITAADNQGGFDAIFSSGSTVPTLVERSASRSRGGLIRVPEMPEVPQLSIGRFSGLDQLCTTECGSSCSGRCVESGERVVGEPRIVGTADGRVWVVYVEARVDLEVRLEEDEDFIFFCSCDHEDPIERAGERSLVLGTIELPAIEGEDPQLVERWRGPLPETDGAAQLAVAARGDVVAVAVSDSQSSTGHLFTIDAAGL